LAGLPVSKGGWSPALPAPAPSGDGSVCPDALRAAVAEAAAQQEKILEGQLLRASIDDARVQAFAAAVRESWGRRRTAANLLRLAGAWEDIDGSNPDARYGYQGYERKDW
jgi:hypothetical protein